MREVITVQRHLPQKTRTVLSEFRTVHGAERYESTWLQLNCIRNTTTLSVRGTGRVFTFVLHKHSAGYIGDLEGRVCAGKRQQITHS